MSKLNLYLLGPPRVEADGAPLELKRRKALALLIYLAGTGEAQQRDSLATLLWPASGQRAARRALTRRVSELNKILGKDWLESDRERVGLRRHTDLWLDVAQFQQKLDDCQTHNHADDMVCPTCLVLLTEAATIYRADFLTGFTLPDCPDFDEWQFFQAEELRQTLALVLERLIQGRVAQGKIEAAIPHARRWLALDSLHEPAQRQLMLLYAQTNRQAAALRQYQICVETLETELGVRPSDETTALYKKIRSGRIASQGEFGIATEQASKGRSEIVVSPPLHRHTPPPQPNLPSPLTSLIGREQAVATARATLLRSEVRLLTLTGAPGIGKTRLGIQVAAELGADIVHGVCFVPLAPISDAGFVVTAIARAFAIKEMGNRPLIERLKDYLRDRHLLLVLDNFEHVLSAAPVIAELLEAASQLKVLVTSRALLRLYGEYEFVVSCLALPDLNRLPPPAEMMAYAAVELFVQRARAARLDFVLNEANARPVSEICVHLDGLPLAIELAAARSKTLSPAAILARLTADQVTRLGLLSGGGRNLPPRQQTLHIAIAWSYDLLSPTERVLFRHLGVFDGGCTPEAMQAIMGDVSSAPASDQIWQTAQSLVDKSLLLQREVDGELRFSMLEMIREYALEQLTLEGEAEGARSLHAAHFLAQLELYIESENEYKEENTRAIQNRLEQDFDNLRAAVTWTTANNPETELRLVVALAQFCNLRRYLNEGRRWLETALERRTPEFSPDYAQAVLLLGMMHWQQGDFVAAQTRLEESANLSRRLQDQSNLATTLMFLSLTHIFQGNYQATLPLADESVTINRALEAPMGLAHSLNSLALSRMVSGDYNLARSHHEESLAIFRQLNHNFGIALALQGLGEVAFSQGDDGTALARLEEALHIQRSLGDIWFVAQTLTYLGKVTWRQGDKGRARALLEESAALSRDVGAKNFLAAALLTLGLAAQERGEVEEAAAMFTESLTLHQAIGIKAGIGYALSGLASLMDQSGQAVQLLGAATRQLDSAHMWMDGLERTHHESNIAAMRGQLEEAAFATAWAEGQAMSLDQVLSWVQADWPLSD